LFLGKDGPVLTNELFHNKTTKQNEIELETENTEGVWKKFKDLLNDIITLMKI
jgi:hypothetical protein